MANVCYTGSWADPSGYGTANRQDIVALYMAGVNLTTELSIHMKERTHFGFEGELAYRLRNRKIPYKIKIIHLTPDMVDTYIEKGKYHILRLMWETDKLPEGWEKFCNKMGEVWTTSPNMTELFRKSGVKVPMYSFPQPIDVSMAEKDWGRFSVSHHKGFLFYSIFQWVERKNPRLLLEAYWEEFKGEENVSLLIKTFRLGYDDREVEKIRDDIRSWRMEAGIVNPPRVLLSFDLLDKDRIMKLHQTGDCYVLPHRGEGWGRTVQEALLCGKPVIATGRGGLHEYLKDEHYFSIPSKYVPVTEVPWIKFYTKDQNWAEADKPTLKKMMRFVFENYTEARAKGIVAQEHIKNQFNYFRVGSMMAERLNKIEKLI